VNRERPITGDEFRRTLGHLPTGVTVIAAEGNQGPVGMAANSVTSVSLDPPLVLFCPAKSSDTWPLIRAARRFCINVVAHLGEELTRRFARKGADRFEGVKWHSRDAGPGLDDAVAWIDCSLREEHDAGDHTIAVADVTALATAESSEPLLFLHGRFGRFSAGAPVAGGAG